MYKARKSTVAMVLGVMLAGVACSSGEPESLGGTEQVSVNLIVDGTDVRSVRFTVEGGDLSSPLEGRFNVHDDQDPPIWATIMDLSPGDYVITLVALDDTGEVLCTGSQGFAVLEGQTTQVDVALLCTVGDGSEPLGNADIEGRFEIVEANLCPRLNYVGVIPDVIEEGGSADVEVLAQDSDGQTVQVTLSATAGTLSPASFDIVPPANGGLSTYTCTTSGTQTVTATVSDGDALCDKAKSVDVGCGDSIPGPFLTIVSVVCSNNVTGDISYLPYTQRVEPLGPVLNGTPVDLAFSGGVLFPPTFLNAAIATIPGLTEVTLTEVAATPHVRAGAVGAPVDLTVLGADGGTPQPVPIPIESDPAICGQIEPPLATCPDLCEDSLTLCTSSAECVGIGGETCEPRAGYCDCVVDPLLIPLTTGIATVTPNAGAGGEMLLGWNEDLLPPQTVIVTNPAGPNGMRVLAVVLNVGLECWMGTIDDNGTPGDPTDDQPRRLLDSELLSIPIN